MAVALGLVVIGFPDFLNQWILAEVNKGDYFIKARAVHLDLRGGLKARNVSVYRKGIPGPPFMEMRECRIFYRFFELPHAGRSRIREIIAHDGVLRPLWSAASSGHKRNWGLHGEKTPGTSEVTARKEVDLDVTLLNFDILGVWADRVKTSLRVDADGIYLSGLSGKLGRELHAGAVEGTLVWGRDGRVSGRVATSFDPHALLPPCKFLYPEAIGMLDRFSFPTARPRLDVTFEASTVPVLVLKVKGRMQAANYAYRGAVIGYASMSGEYSFGGGTNRLQIDPFSFTIRGRHARGHVVFDLAGGVSSFVIDSEVSLASLLRIVGLKESLMKDWDFEEDTRVIAKGRVGHSVPGGSEIEATVEGSKISYRGMAVSNYAFTYKGQGMTHAFSHFRGNSGGGFISGSGMVTPGNPARTPWGEINAEIINVDIDEILKLLSANPGWRVGGKLFGTLQFMGIGTNLVGRGQLTVRSAKLFKSPLGAGLLGEWGLATHGFDLADVPADVRFSFDLKENRVASRDVQVEVGNLAVTAEGWCGLDGSLDWAIKPTSGSGSGAGQTVMALHKSLRQGAHVLTGTIKQPEWRPVVRKTRN